MPSLRDVDAVLLDVDGTLVDTTYLHALCWSDAFAELGLPRPTADLHRLDGMDAERLIVTALPDAPPARQQRDDLARRHGELYREHWPTLRALPGARELLHHLHGRGITTVLASSATDEELAALRKALHADDWIDEATTSDDAAEGKPAPDLLQEALRRAGAPAERALLVGDAVWDGEAARRAGIRFIGVTCGGIPEAALRDAGAQEVFPDPAYLLAHLT
ncbi:MAG: family hydrolase [Frankiales bacterium]|nr:family hydrolase [Frankiales bacterium]